MEHSDINYMAKLTPLNVRKILEYNFPTLMKRGK